MNVFKKIWSKEPVLVSALPTVVGLLATAGVLNTGQEARITSVAAAVVAFVGALVARVKVTSPSTLLKTAAAAVVETIEDSQLPPIDPPTTPNAAPADPAAAAAAPAV